MPKRDFILRAKLLLPRALYGVCGAISRTSAVDANLTIFSVGAAISTSSSLSLPSLLISLSASKSSSSMLSSSLSSPHFNGTLWTSITFCCGRANGVAVFLAFTIELFRLVQLPPVVPLVFFKMDFISLARPVFCCTASKDCLPPRRAKTELLLEVAATLPLDIL